MRLAGWACVVWLLLAVPAPARDVLVSNVSGDDRNTGHDWQSTAERIGPIRTIRRALELTQFGDRVVLANTQQPNRESVGLVGVRHGGGKFTPFILLGNGAILDGSAPVPPVWEHFEEAVFRFHPNAGGPQQLFLRDRPVPLVPADFNAGRPPKLKPLQWSLVQGEIYFCVEKDKLPADYALTYTSKETGITLYHVEQVAILDLIVQGFRLDGINLNTARSVQIKGVTSRGNGRYGIAVGGASQVDIEDCTLGQNARAQLFTAANSETHLRASDLLPLTAPAWVDEGGLFYLNDKRLQGGLEKISREEKDAAKP